MSLDPDLGNLRSRSEGGMSYRVRFALFGTALIGLMYLRGYDQETKLMGWSVIVGLGAAGVLTCFP